MKPVNICQLFDGRNGVAHLNANQSIDRLVNLTAEYKKSIKIISSLYWQGIVMRILIREINP